jgi:hypothetical protein
LFHSRASTAGLNESFDCGLRIADCGLLSNIHSFLSYLRRAAPNSVTGLISACFSKSAVRDPQFVIAYAIFPGEVALSAIGEFQIKEVANYEANGDADFPDYFGGG